jgi:hypothetical protein
VAQLWKLKDVGFIHNVQHSLKLWSLQRLHVCLMFAPFEVARQVIPGHP